MLVLLLISVIFSLIPFPLVLFIILVSQVNQTIHTLAKVVDS